jgi:hypothetical protein
LGALIFVEVAMLRMRTPRTLRLGEQYVRANDPETVWTVRRIVAMQRVPQHVELVSDGLHRRCVFVSSTVLRDRRQYRPVTSDKAAAGAAVRPRGWRSLLGW